MIDYLCEYQTVFDKELNTDLMTRAHDKPLLDYIIECWKSLEVIRGVKILNWEYTDKESEIDINKYIFKRERGKKKGEKWDYKYIDDSRLGLLTVTVQIHIEYIDVKDGEKKIEEQIIKKSMLIPLQDEDGYFWINGKRVYLIYQLVEKSTYTAPNAVILKSLMPFATRRHIEHITNTRGESFKVPRYTLELFKKDVDVMLIYASYVGMDWALQYALGAPYLVMKFVEEEDVEDTKNMYFRISNKLLLMVNRQMFNNFIYVRSVVGGILFDCTNRLTIDMLNDTTIWLKKLGTNNAEKGKSLLERSGRLLDETTGRILRMDLYHKHDVLSLTRWMCQEYNDLRLKDNMDLNNKRLRSVEIISALFTLSLSTRANRLMGLGKRATMDSYKDLFSFPGDIIIQLINSSGIQRYNDIVNDLDFFSKFKYTIKGPNSLGNRNSKNISAAYRGLHHSFIGRVDLTVCGNSDPGTSGLISPFTKMDGLYFDDTLEPDDEVFRLRNAIEDLIHQEGFDYVMINFEKPEDFYSAANAMRHFVDENIRVYMSSKDDDYSLIINEDVVM